MINRQGVGRQGRRGSEKTGKPGKEEKRKEKTKSNGKGFLYSVFLVSK
jgi:hypothetical protein